MLGLKPTFEGWGAQPRVLVVEARVTPSLV